jgi:hypothetical protein
VIAPAARALAAFVAGVSPAPPIGRRAAEQLARRELARPQYQESVVSRILSWLARQLERFSRALGGLPGGVWPTVVLLVALVVVIAAVAIWLRPAAVRRSVRGDGLSGSPLSARAHRELAERYAAEGDYSAAIIEAMRAVAAGVEERGLLTARPGRTADELAVSAGQVLPDLASDLSAAAHLFDGIRYGSREGTASGYDAVRQLEARLRAARAGVTEPEPAVAPGPS